MGPPGTSAARGCHAAAGETVVLFQTAQPMVGLLPLGNYLGPVYQGLPVDWLGLLRGPAVSGHDSQGLSSCTCLGDNFLAEFGQGGGQGRLAVLSGVDRVQVPQLNGIVNVHIRAGQAESGAGIEEMDFHEFA
jgi:hypothetical protein